MSDVQRVRLEALQRQIKAANMEYLALVPGFNLQYLTGEEFFLLERPFITFIPADKNAQMLVVIPELEAPTWRRVVPFEARLLTWTDETGPDEAMREAAVFLEGLQTLGVEHQRMRVMEQDLIARFLPDIRIAKGEGVLDPLRLRKDAAEVASLRRAVQALETALERTISHLRPGMIEREICSDLTVAVLQSGGEMVTLEPLVQTGSSSALPHGRTGNRPVEEGDILLIDFTTTVDGYYADMTRTFVVGRQADDRQQEVYAAVKAANKVGREAARPGVTCQDVDRAARGAIVDAGYGEYFIHRTGHGLGLDVHEPPSIVEGNQLQLEEGMVFTIEPGIYIEGWGGVRIEDNVVVTREGVESLTTFGRDLRVVAV
ncbi:MAG: aminopeptidase P family protein [Anaerolineae bacterium]|nr:MAG: aminopeptidase P family protein [Anaerolineae bacterium]